MIIYLELLGGNLPDFATTMYKVLNEEYNWIFSEPPTLGVVEHNHTRTNHNLTRD